MYKKKIYEMAKQFGENMRKWYQDKQIKEEWLAWSSENYLSAIRSDSLYSGREISFLISFCYKTSPLRSTLLSQQGRSKPIPLLVLTLNNKGTTFLLHTILLHITRTQVWFDRTYWSKSVPSWSSVNEYTQGEILNLNEKKKLRTTASWW